MFSPCWFHYFGVTVIPLSFNYFHPLPLTIFHTSSAPQARYVQAKLSVHDRSLKVATVIESLEMEMELLCLTGVEDQLQTDVRPTLEILRNAGIKVWGEAGGQTDIQLRVATNSKNTNLEKRTCVFHIYPEE